MSSMYDASDFKSLKYDVININGKVLDSIPALSKIKSFVDCPYRSSDKDRVIKLIVLFYDKKSPLVKIHRDYDIRWNEAATLAGFDLEKDFKFLARLYEFTPEEVSDEGVVLVPSHFEKMVIDFLIDLGDLSWAMIVSNEKTFFEFQKAAQQIVVTFTTDKDKLNAIAVKSKLLEDSERIAIRLDGLYLKVFGDGKINEKARGKSFTPESVAKNVQ